LIHTYIPYNIIYMIWWRGDEFDGKLFQAFTQLKKGPRWESEFNVWCGGWTIFQGVGCEKRENWKWIRDEINFMCAFTKQNHIHIGNGIVYNWKSFIMRLPHHHYFIFTLCTTNYMPFYRFSFFRLSLTFNRHSRSTFRALFLFLCSKHYDITHYILQPTPKCHQIRHKLCSS